MAESQTQLNSAAAPPRRAGLLPDTLTIAVCGLLLAAGIASALVADRVLQLQSQRSHRAAGELVSDLVAAQIAAQPDGVAALAAGLKARAAPPSAVSAVQWTPTGGSETTLWSRDGASLEPGAGTTIKRPIAADGGPPLGVLTVQLAPTPIHPHRATLVLLTAAVLGAVLSGYLVVYERLRRRLRPLEAIERNLHDYAHGIEGELRALGVSAAFGEIAAWWNHLIEQVSELQQQTGGGGDDGEVQQSALSRFENRTLRGLLDALPVGVLRLDAQQHVKYANAAAGRLLGAARGQQLTGAALADYVGGDCTEPLAGALARGSKSRPIDKRLGDKEDAPTIRMQALPPPTEVDGEGLLVLQDISHLLEAERARDQFLYHVTHELRTPLTNIHAYAETLSQPDFDDEQIRKECYNVILSETKRLSSLVEDILSLSQLEVGTLRIDWGDVELARLLRGMVQDNLGKADEKRIDLTLKLPPKVPPMRGDKQRLAVLLNNLIGNAIKYTPEGGRVEVGLEAGEQWVQVQVSDTGIGIAPEDQARVFDKFYRAGSDEVQQIKGTGLGLAIAREVARMHGGDIHLKSAPGEGSVFTLELPTNADKGR